MIWRWTSPTVKPGDTAKLDVLRDGDQQSISVAVAQTCRTTARRQRGQRRRRRRARWAWHWPRCRRTCAPSSSLPKGTKGAVVAEVQPGSPAEAAGIQAGDVIVGVGQQGGDLARGRREAPFTRRRKDKDGALALRIIRDGQAAFVAVTLNQTANPAGDDNTAG